MISRFLFKAFRNKKVYKVILEIDQCHDGQKFQKTVKRGFWKKGIEIIVNFSRNVSLKVSKRISCSNCKSF